MQEFLNKKVLATTDRWFYAPDGKQYRSVFGTLKAIHEVGKTLGFIPNRSHANWFYEIGDMIIMGCQILYIIQTDVVETGKVKEWCNEKGLEEYERPTAIYVTS